MIDLTVSCAHTAKLLEGVRDEDLSGRTPCEHLTVGELVAHIGGLAVAFAAAARKDLGALTDTPPEEGGYRLDDDWRTRYPADLAELAQAWRAPEAWAGMTRVGGVDLPGELAGLVALAEVVIHGWDLAQATSQSYDVDGDVAEAVLAHVAASAAEGPVDGLFGPAVEPPPGATTWQRALALSGRRPGLD